MKAPEPTPESKAIVYARGVLDALTIVFMHDDEVIYGEIVGLVGGAGLLVAALDPEAPGEDAAHYGLVKYGYTTRAGKLKRRR